jgi:hypothetical protein
MRELERSGKRNEAIWAGMEAQKTGFNLAVALGLVELQRAAGDAGGARKALDGVTKRRRFTVAEGPLAAEAARLLREFGDAKAAVSVWYAILGDRGAPKEVRVSWLKSAVDAARAAKDARQALRWEEELKELTAPPVKTAE